MSAHSRAFARIRPRCTQEDINKNNPAGNSIEIESGSNERDIMKKKKSDQKN